MTRNGSDTLCLSLFWVITTNAQLTTDQIRYIFRYATLRQRYDSRRIGYFTFSTIFGDYGKVTTHDISDMLHFCLFLVIIATSPLTTDQTHDESDTLRLQLFCMIMVTSRRIRYVTFSAILGENGKVTTHNESDTLRLQLFCMITVTFSTDRIRYIFVYCWCLRQSHHSQRIRYFTFLVILGNYSSIATRDRSDTLCSWLF